MIITRWALAKITQRVWSSKTGWGPYRLHRRSEHFVGTEPSVLKYHVLQDKKPLEPYGLQGNNHLQPRKGKVYGKLPTRVLMKKDKVYAWCSCGYSGSQPLCDGNHLSVRCPITDMRPVRFIPDRDMEVWLCNCKQTANRPFCDGSHRKLEEKSDRSSLFE